MYCVKVVGDCARECVFESVAGEGASAIGVDEIEWLLTVSPSLEVSSGCEVEISTVAGDNGLTFETGVFVRVRVAGIEGMHEGGRLEGHWIAWYILPW